jgi:hypothetical protein
MARKFAYRFRVRYDELDSFGHLNNAVCVKFMQEAAIQGSADAGYALPWYDAQGVAWVIRRLRVRYYLQVRYGDSWRWPLGSPSAADRSAIANTRSRAWPTVRGGARSRRLGLHRFSTRSALARAAGDQNRS